MDRTDPAYAAYSARSRIDDVRTHILAFVTLLELADDGAKADLFGGALKQLGAARRVLREIELELDRVQENLTRAAELVGDDQGELVRRADRGRR